MWSVVNFHLDGLAKCVLIIVKISISQTNDLRNILINLWEKQISIYGSNISILLTYWALKAIEFILQQWLNYETRRDLA